ncbi:MAG: hypothetical protein ACREBG_01860 [Pyrinomonadaceae bacterium]
MSALLPVFGGPVWIPPPFGQPGVRDPDFPCAEFAPGEPNGRCSSDGHYLCHECKHLDPESWVTK